MSAPAKLAGFAAALALLFGGAALAGGAVGPEPSPEARSTPESSRADGHSAMEDTMSTPTTTRTTEPAHGHEAPARQAAEAVRGLAVSDDGLKLALARTDVVRGRPTTLRFDIVARDGRTVRDFAVEHEKRMHLIVVRRDGRGFQHLHPEMTADGTWRVRLTLPDAGSYRVFADFKRDGEARTLAADLSVDGDADYRALPAPAATADTGDGYVVRLDAGRVRAGDERELRFTVSKGGRVVHTEPYLGAGGHLVALREGDLAYLHVHPAGHGDEHGGGGPAGGHDDAVPFATEFPSEGRYRLYLQFKHDGRVHTAEFTQEVAR